MPQVEYEDIIPGEGALNKDLRDKKGGKTGIKFYAGDVLYGKLRPYLMNWLYPQFNGVAVGDFWVLRATECDSSFLYRLVQTGSFQRLANVSSGSKMPRADWNLISQSFFAVPADHAEQKAIAKGLAELDTLITLHQRKYDKLCVLKKSMLDKMFPKGGSLYPEIRFAGFTDPWEQRKVGDFLSESRIKGNTGLNSRKLTVKLWGKGVIEKNDFGGSEHTQYFIRHKGQFIYSKLDFLNSAFGVIPEKLDGYESTADLPAFDLVEMNPHFMFFTAIQEGFYLKHGSAADGSRKAKRIHVNTFLEMPIMVPTVAEQDLIVEYLQSLDCLITLHQRKLELLRNIKKSMLDKMFV